jgi:hypothetical protein
MCHSLWYNSGHYPPKISTFLDHILTLHTVRSKGVVTGMAFRDT